MAGEAAPELEAMRKDDLSWHPCRVSLRPSTTSTSSNVIIHFGDFSEEVVISSKEEALKRLRYSSTFLQDGDCTNVDEGECVLAMNKLHSQSLFFDAVIEKVLRVRHSKRVYCRCTFEVKWIHSKWNWDVMNLSSSAIKKLSRKSINSHPVIAGFVNSLTPATSFQIPSHLSFLEEIKGEADIQGLLESQVQKISTDPDENKGSEEVIIVTKDSADVAKCTRSKAIESEVSPLHTHNDFERCNGMQEKLQFEEVKKNPEDRHFLSPLAARAALASLVHELPQKSEIFACHVGQVFSQFPFINSVKHIDSPSVNRSCSFRESNVLIHGNLSTVQELSQKTSNVYLCEPKYECEADITNEKVARKRQSSKESTDVLTRETRANMAKKPDNTKLDNPNLAVSSSHSATKMTSRHSSSTMRQTRSMIQKVNQELSDEKEKILSNKHHKVTTDKGTKIRTSTKQKPSSHPISEITQVSKENNLSPELELEDFKQGLDTQKYYGEKNSVTSLSDYGIGTSSVPGMKKRRTLSGSIITYEMDQGEISTGGKIPEEKKVVPSSKPETQFSHRPRTRSQR